LAVVNVFDALIFSGALFHTLAASHVKLFKKIYIFFHRENVIVFELENTNVAEVKEKLEKHFKANPQIRSSNTGGGNPYYKRVCPQNKFKVVHLQRQRCQIKEDNRVSKIMWTRDGENEREI
jgi:hypothetical protein